MLDHLDNLLRHLFLTNVPLLTEAAQVRFEPPDADWRLYASNLTVNGDLAMALNVYLVEMRENRHLRTNDHSRTFSNGSATDTPAPRRVDCHYLITAWSPATATPAVEPTIDEQSLLYDVTALLMDSEPFVPRQVYAPDPLPVGFPALLADAELPITVLPVEGFPKYAEFWGTMGQKHPWKPAVYLVVTVPVALRDETAGALVTTRVTSYVRAGGAGDADVWIQIGGTLHDLAAKPLAGGWVGLSTTADVLLQETTTNELGRFTFGSLTAGSYRLRARATGFGEAARDVDVPSLTGEYDLSLP